MASHTQLVAIKLEGLERRPFFHPDARVDWVCTNERFTLDEYITANCRYPDPAGRHQAGGPGAPEVQPPTPKQQRASRVRGPLAFPWQYHFSGWPSFISKDAKLLKGPGLLPVEHIMADLVEQNDPFQFPCRGLWPGCRAVVLITGQAFCYYDSMIADRITQDKGGEEGSTM